MYATNAFHSSTPSSDSGRLIRAAMYPVKSPGSCMNTPFTPRPRNQEPREPGKGAPILTSGAAHCQAQRMSASLGFKTAVSHDEQHQALTESATTSLATLRVEQYLAHSIMSRSRLPNRSPRRYAASTLSAMVWASAASATSLG